MTASKPTTTPDQDASEYGFLELLRRLERDAENLPAIGKSTRLKDEFVALGQDPYTGFADGDLSEVDLGSKPAKVRPRFLGFYGPFGALPMAMTREVDHWRRNGDAAFVAFTDIFVTRFLQLFYRTWSDSRAITQFDHPSDDSFPYILRALTGDAGAGYSGRGVVHDTSRLRYTSLQHGRVKSPVRLRKILSTHFDIKVRVEEFAASWLEFPETERSLMGVASSGLGLDLKLGRGTFATHEKLIIHVDCSDNAEYQDFLPGHRKHAELVDLVTGYLGQFYKVDVELWLPKSCVAPAKLSSSIELGWSGALQQVSDGSTLESVIKSFITMPASIERAPLEKQAGKSRIPAGTKMEQWLLWGVIRLNKDVTLHSHKIILHIALTLDEAENFETNSWMYKKFLSDILETIGRFEQIEIVVLVPSVVEADDGKLVERTITAHLLEPEIDIIDDTFVKVCRYQIQLEDVNWGGSHDC